MNLNYLGDALDHWKGSLFEYLQREDVLHQFAVDPMASDQEEWAEDDFAIYGRLLRVNDNQLIDHQSTLSTRQLYFAEIRHTGDLFLDPDRGISTSRRLRNGKKHIKPQEVVSLLCTQHDRLLAVYQHVRGIKVSERVEECLDAIRDTNRFGWCSYESGTVAMLFLSHRTKRTIAVQRALQCLLGRHTNRRVRCGEI